MERQGVLLTLIYESATVVVGPARVVDAAMMHRGNIRACQSPKCDINCLKPNV